MYVSYEQIYDQLSEIAEYVNAMPDASEYFKEKFAGLANPEQGRKTLKIFQYELSAAKIDPSGRVVLDAGCGSGLYSVLFSLMGSSKTRAIDFFPENLESLNDLAAQFNLPIETQFRDISDTGIQSDSINIIYCREAISHFHDWSKFIVETARLLNPNGTLLISDWNNGANYFVRRRIYNYWELMERGPFSVDKFGPDQFTPFLFRRWMIIKEKFPEFSDNEVFRLGQRTFGKGGDELIEICRQYCENKIMPDFVYRRGESSIKPDDGQRDEEPVDPRNVVTSLKDLGVKARFFPYYGYSRSRLLPLVNSIANSIRKFTILFSPKYLVIGSKQ